jgi:hypothetical protein
MLLLYLQLRPPSPTMAILEMDTAVDLSLAVPTKPFSSCIIVDSFMSASNGTITYGRPLEPIEVDYVLQVWLWHLRVISQPNNLVGQMTCGRHRWSRQTGPNEINRAKIVYQMECHISQDSQVSVVYSFLERIL